jgi:hypothetical protein
VIHLFVKMERKADEASDFGFMHLIEQGPWIYNIRQPDYAWQDKVDLAWGKNSHKMNESGMCVNVYTGCITNLEHNCRRRFPRSL